MRHREPRPDSQTKWMSIETACFGVFTTCHKCYNEKVEWCQVHHEYHDGCRYCDQICAIAPEVEQWLVWEIADGEMNLVVQNIVDLLEPSAVLVGQ